MMCSTIRTDPCLPEVMKTAKNPIHLPLLSHLEGNDTYNFEDVSLIQLIRSGLTRKVIHSLNLLWIMAAFFSCIQMMRNQPRDLTSMELRDSEIFSMVSK